MLSDVIQLFNRILFDPALALDFIDFLGFRFVVHLLIEGYLTLGLVDLVEGYLNLNLFIGYPALLHKVLKCSFTHIKPVPLPM